VPDTEALPPVPWERVPRRDSRRRRDPITQEAVVGAALRLLDADGLDALSMRRIAEELGTGAATLYWHVGSKDGLLDLLFDRVIGEIAVPDPKPGRWQQQLKELARTMRTTIAQHRDIVRISIGRIPMGPNALQHSERVLAILRSGGVPDLLAVHGYHLLTAAINGFMLDETGEAGEPPADQPPLEELAGMARNYLAGLPPQRFPNLVEVADYYAMSDPDARFELMIEIFVSGLAAQAALPARRKARRSPASGGAPRPRTGRG
jgi:AcrR family transcriptional regulator